MVPMEQMGKLVVADPGHRHPLSNLPVRSWARICANRRATWPLLAWPGCRLTN